MSNRVYRVTEIVGTSPDGIDHITVKATSITLTQLLAATPGSPITIAGAAGTLAITGYNAGTGAVRWGQESMLAMTCLMRV